VGPAAWPLRSRRCTHRGPAPRLRSRLGLGFGLRFGLGFGLRRTLLNAPAYPARSRTLPGKPQPTTPLRFAGHTCSPSPQAAQTPEVWHARHTGGSQVPPLHQWLVLGRAQDGSCLSAGARVAKSLGGGVLLVQAGVGLPGWSWRCGRGGCEAGDDAQRAEASRIAPGDALGLLRPAYGVLRGALGTDGDPLILALEEVRHAGQGAGSSRVRAMTRIVPPPSVTSSTTTADSPENTVPTRALTSSMRHRRLRRRYVTTDYGTGPFTGQTQLRRSRIRRRPSRDARSRRASPLRSREARWPVV
jgi:hypothetical protein